MKEGRLAAVLPPESSEEIPDVPAGPDLDDDYHTVTLLSVGLLRIHLARWDGPGRPLQPWKGLLPIEWRQGVTRMWWRCAYAGRPQLRSDLQLLTMCRYPLGMWDAGLRLAPNDLEACLLEGDEISEFTEQAARLLRSNDVDAELRENKINASLRRTVAANAQLLAPDGPGPERDAAAQEAYVALRTLILRNTVLSSAEWRALNRRFPATGATGQPVVSEFLNLAYDVIDASAGHRTWLCPTCRNVLADRAMHCGTPGCRGGQAEVFSVQGRHFVLERAARRFIHDPGLVEARIFDALNDLHLSGRVRLTAYPRLDTLDLLVEFLREGVNGTEVVETWGADAKDQRSASLLGRGFRWPSGMDCTGRFIVIPDHRCRSGYLEELRTELSGRVAGIDVISETEFVTRVHHRAEVICR